MINNKFRIQFYAVLLIIIMSMQDALSQQYKMRLDIITECLSFHTIYNKVPNRVNYFSKSDKNKDNCICKLQSKDTVNIKRLNEYEYLITPLFTDNFLFESIVLYENCKGKIIDSIIIDVIPTPPIHLFENTHKSYTYYDNQADDGMLDSLFFYIHYGIDLKRFESKLDLDVVNAEIHLLNSRNGIIDSFNINRNYLTSEQKQKMRKYYTDLKSDYKFIQISNIFLKDKNGVSFIMKDSVLLPAKAILRIGP